MSRSAIENALASHLATMPPGVDVAWPGLAYEPKSKTPYLRVAHVHGETVGSAQETGPDAPVLRTGVFIITPVYPVTHGPGPFLKMIETIEARFKRRQTLQASTQTHTFAVTLVETDRGILVSKDGLNSLPVKCSWRSKAPS